MIPTATQTGLSSRTSAFATARPIAAAFTHVEPTSRRAQLKVYAAKGKQRMRGGGGGMQQKMPNIPTPPVDPENVEFVIFVRSKKLPQWVPLSIMKGGAAANMLVKTLENDLGKKMYGNQLINNVARAIYKDRVLVEESIRKQFPMFKETREFEYGFKIRDTENPKNWYMVTPDLELLPPEAEVEETPIDKVGNFFNDLGKGLGINQ